MERWQKSWNFLYDSLKENWNGLNEHEKETYLNTLTEAKEAVLDKWMEMDEKLIDLEEELKSLENSQISYRSRGTSYFDLNMYEEAINEFLKEKDDNNKLFIQLYLGYSYMYITQFEKAKETFLYIIHMNPSILETHLAYAGLGIIHEQQQYYEEAIPYFEKALSLTKNIDVLYNLGTCHAQLKQYGIALNYFKKYIQQDDTDGETYYHLGYCHMQLGEITEAFEAWITALQTVETKELLFTLAYEFEYHGFHLASIHCLKRLEALGFDDVSIAHGIAWNYGLLNEKEQSKQMFENLIQWNPKDINIAISYVWLLRAWGEEVTQPVWNRLPETSCSHPLMRQLI